MRAIITVIGTDQVGIIAKVSALLAKTGCNIVDLSQTVMQEFFTMIMLVDLTTCNVEFGVLREQMDALGQEIGMDVRIQREEIFNSMHRI